MILASVLGLAATAVLLGLVALAGTQAPPIAAEPPPAHPRAAMRLVFVTVHAEHLVIDGLLELDPPSVGIPTAWSFACPEHPVLAAATLDALERWADDGLPVAVDLSKVAGSRPSVAFRRDEVLVRLSALPQHSAHGPA